MLNVTRWHLPRGLARVGAWAERSTADVRPWTNVYGVARSVLAAATALTLLFNDAGTLFPVVPRSMMAPPYCGGVRHVAAFCVVPPSRLELARWLCIALLAVVASGYRPRWTGLVHAWVSFSLAVTTPLLDGGDQVTSVLTLLLVPVTLTDRRRWHWSHEDDDAPAAAERPLARVAAWLALGLVRLQVAGIYFHAAAGKLTVEDWANGTALHYWLRHPIVGVPPWAATFMLPLTQHAVPLVLLTWGVIALELLLGVAFLCSPRLQRALLVLGLLLHLGILLLHGLVSFALVMMAALVLYLRPGKEPFAAPASWLTRARARPLATAPASRGAEALPGAAPS